MKTIFGLVGPTGAGKTTLILEIMERIPEKIAIVKSLTTRSRRNDGDLLFYDFTSVEDIMRRKTEGRLVQVSEYAGNLYANDRDDLDVTLQGKMGIAALVEEGVNNLRHAGYHVVIIKVIPFHNKPAADAIRAQADEQRALTHMPADLVLNNSFEPGGLEKAADQLAQFIRGFIR